MTDRIEAIREALAEVAIPHGPNALSQYAEVAGRRRAAGLLLLEVLEEVRARLGWHAYEDYDADHIRVSGITEVLMRHMGEDWLNAAPVAPDAEPGGA